MLDKEAKKSNKTTEKSSIRLYSSAVIAHNSI